MSNPNFAGAQRFCRSESSHHPCLNSQDEEQHPAMKAIARQQRAPGLVEGLPKRLGCALDNGLWAPETWENMWKPGGGGTSSVFFLGVAKDKVPSQVHHPPCQVCPRTGWRESSPTTSIVGGKKLKTPGGIFQNVPNQRNQDTNPLICWFHFCENISSAVSKYP